MRKRIMWLALVALVAPALWLGSAAKPDWQEHALGFEKKLAGGWLAVFDVGYAAEVLVSLTADGGVTFSSTLRPAGADGKGAWMGTRYNTTSHGSWKRTGPCKLEAVTLLFVQDNDGNTVMYEKVMLELTLTAHGTRLEGTGLIHLIEKGNNPLDPNAPVLYAIPVPAIAARPIQ